MSVPSVVIFDLGKVLVDFDYGIAAAKIAQRSQRGAGRYVQRCSNVRVAHPSGVRVDHG